MPLFYSTAKLIKLLKIPVYIPLFSGGSGVFPRWGKSRRKGIMELTIHTLFDDGSEIRKLSSDEIFNRMRRIINYRDMDKTIAEKNWHYQSSRRAEYLEAILFICPDCRSIASLRSQGNRIACSHCGFEASLDDQYRFHRAAQSDFVLKTPLAWNQWQEKILSGMLQDYKKEG